MVRHHVKKSKKNRQKSNLSPAALKQQELEQKLRENFDDFAGSSGEENEQDDISEQVDDDDDDDDASEGAEEPMQEEEEEDDDLDEKQQESDNDNEDDEEEGSNDDGEPTTLDRAHAMADVMSRILGTGDASNTTSVTNNNAVVLSKTVTKLQRAQAKEKSEEAELRKKRRANREDNLIAMHVPQVTDNVQLERAHRRVATRGIVALFNAIAKHQQQGPDTENHNSSAMKGGDDKVATSKYSFMEKLKETAANKVKNSTSTSSVETKLNGNAASSNSGAVGSNSKSVGRAAAAGWDALKDDFMMGSKLKDWDKEDNETESEDEVQPPKFAVDGKDDLSDAEEYDAEQRELDVKAEKRASMEKALAGASAKKKRRQKR